MLSTRSAGTNLPRPAIGYTVQRRILKSTPLPPLLGAQPDGLDLFWSRQKTGEAKNRLMVTNASSAKGGQSVDVYGIGSASGSPCSHLSIKGEAKPHACPPLYDPQADPGLQIEAKTDAQKLETACMLSDWMHDALKKHDAQIAVVARPGRWLTKLQDQTRMEHSGLAVYDANAKKWEIYELLNDLCGAHPQSRLCKSEAVDFFYAQPGYDKDAMLLLPEPPVQKQILKGIRDGSYKHLFFTSHYNIVTTFDTSHSLNCNKWVLMNVAAARIGSYDPGKVLDAIGEQFKPGYVWVPPVLRPLAKKHPTVFQKEVPSFGPIRTVTAESLYRSDWFPTKLFHSEKRILFGQAQIRPAKALPG